MPRSGCERSKNDVTLHRNTKKRRRLRDLLRLLDDRLSTDDASGKSNRSQKRGRSEAPTTDDDDEAKSCAGDALRWSSCDSRRELSRTPVSTLTHHLPTTPSPICSSFMSSRCLYSPPASSVGSFIHHSAAATEQPPSEDKAKDKASCGLSNGEAAECFFTKPVDVQVDRRSQDNTCCKTNSLSPPQLLREQIEQGRRSKSRKSASKAFKLHKFQTHNKTVDKPNTRRNEHRLKQCSPPNCFQKEKLAKSAGQLLLLQSRRGEFPREISLDIVDKDGAGRRSAEGDEQEKREQSNNSQLQSMSTQMPLSDGCSLGTDLALSSGSPVEGTSLRNFKPGRRSNAMESKLTEWFEAKTVKLIRRFRKKEAAIEEWEKERIGKAKLAMEKFEIKWENKRLKEIEKMHLRITSTQQEAERRKFKEHQAVTEELAKASKTFENIFTSGKRTWRFVFL